MTNPSDHHSLALELTGKWTRLQLKLGHLVHYPDWLRYYEQCRKSLQELNVVKDYEMIEGTLDAYADACHKANIRWWQNPETGEPIDRNKGELLMLIVSEIAEAMEGERKQLMDAHLPNRLMAEVELVDALIRIFDYAGAFGYDLEGTFKEKMRYNATRADHTHEARVAPGGKKW